MFKLGWDGRSNHHAQSYCLVVMAMILISLPFTKYVVPQPIFEWIWAIGVPVIFALFWYILKDMNYYSEDDDRGKA